MKNHLIRLITALILLPSLLFGCAGIPGKKVKLKDYPAVNKNILKTSKISYFIVDNLDKSQGFNIGTTLSKINSPRDFNEELVRNFSKNNIESYQRDNGGCVTLVDTSKRDDEFDGICGPYFIISYFTLFTLPFYCQHNYQATATLIHYPSESSLKDRSINVNPKQVDFSNNKIQIKQTKKGNYLLTEDKQRINEGDYFLDENNNLAKLLKTYELKDKVHEYWSLIALLGEIFVAVIHPSTIKNSNISTPERAKIDTENNISEALTRSILNDAKSFPECQKNDDGKDRDQKNLSNK